VPCYYPLQGFRARTVNKSGRRSIVFNERSGFKDLPVTVPCGRCIGCRLEYSRQWAIRSVHEASLYDENCFITLTYNDENLPRDGGLNKKHHQDFMKRLRVKYAPRSIRFLHCGEYGDDNLRPHYHTLLFNFDFPDKKLYAMRQGNRIYRSAVLEKLWPFGFSTIGAVTFESAAYVARYVMKKMNGPAAEKHYRRVDPDTGEEFQVIPEYITMSRRPGLGTEWYEKYKGDVYPEDFVVIRGKRMRPPRFYDKLYSADEQAARELKNMRIDKASVFALDQTYERLVTREKVKKAQIGNLKRNV
jgi:hypothetical protein